MLTDISAAAAGCLGPIHTAPLTCPPPAGFSTAVASATSPLANSTSCGFSPWASACVSLASRTLAIETDPSCLVTLVVLGDSGCSQPAQLTLVTG